MDETSMLPIVGLAFGVALGFAGAFGGFGAFAIVLILGVVGYLGGRALGGSLDLTEVFTSRRNSSDR